MTRLKTILILILLIISGGSLWAEGTDQNAEVMDQPTASTLNPFESQLPVIEPPAPKPLTPAEGKVESPEVKGGGQDKAAALPKPPLPALNITGLVWGSKKPQAIINGEIIKVGDTISGVKIVSIKKQSIEIEFYGEVLTIEVK